MKRILLCLLLICLPTTLLPAQPAASGQSSMTLSEAKSLYQRGKDYESIAPVFARELKKKPSDYSLNLWYGTCLYRLGCPDEALPYLTKGKKGKLPEASYELACLYFDRHDTKNCQQQLDDYILFNTGKHPADIARMIKACDRIERMTAHAEAVTVIDSVVVHRDEVTGHLQLSPSCGRIGLVSQLLNSLKEPDSCPPAAETDSSCQTAAPDSCPPVAGADSSGQTARADSCPLASETDSSCQATGSWTGLGQLAYVTEKGDRIYLSDSTSGNMDLAVSRRLLDGWETEPLDANLNRPGSHECHPYLLSDGITLYFASDRPDGLGGFDLYVSRYNSVTESYYAPELLPMPFNSFGNDYLYLVDEQIGRGYLVSDRRQAPDSVVIYTFLPNQARQPLKGLPPEEMRSRAELRAIADTWDGLNADSVCAALDSAYRESLRFQTAFVADNEEEPADGPGEFLLCDGQTCHGESDFQSAEARSQYRRYVQCLAESRQTDNELAKAREQYGQADEPTRQAAAKLILELESRQRSLRRELSALEQQIRQTEIGYRRQ